MSDFPTEIKRIAIVGVGLIGGSIGAAVKTVSSSCEVIGIGRDDAKLSDAARMRLIDRGTTSIENTQADLVVICTPVDRIAEDAIRIADELAPPSLITDAGSVKASICDAVRGQLADGIEFVGSHPLAGSEKQGHQHAEADLFRDRVCVVTPEDHNSEAGVDRIVRFWKSLGMRVLSRSPTEHDHVLATTSHLPHLVASALADLIDEESIPFTATGFRDTTRIAAGDPGLWTAIFQHNASAVAAATDHLIARLHHLRDALADDDGESIRALLADAKALRDRL